MKLWTPIQNADILLDINAVEELKKSAAAQAGAGALLAKTASSSGAIELACGQYYYIDNFILAAVANSMLMFSYELHDGPKNDVKR